MGLEESTLCHLNPSKCKFWETTLTIDRVRIHVCHYGGEDNKNAYSNASFSSVTAATESLGLNDNGFKTA